MISFKWGAEPISLLPERAVLLPRRRTLVIADPHFGKAAAFRQAGIPIPHGTTKANLERLSSVLTRTAAERLVVLGDFFHAAEGCDEQTFAKIEAWRGEHRQLEVLLVRGNHDRASGDPPEVWGIRCVAPPMVDDGLAYSHLPEPMEDMRVLAGHIHPAVRLRDPCGGSFLRAACFWFQPRLAVLPAFGSFTGTYTVSPQPKDRVFVVGDGAVVEVTRRRRARAR